MHEELVLLADAFAIWVMRVLRNDLPAKKHPCLSGTCEHLSEEECILKLSGDYGDDILDVLCERSGPKRDCGLE